ncbi:hypothetical protein KTD33_30565 [Burkholderia gladioli]|uniref:hypothetical protein n=1 Tax=Burkholderia gladioli TaxID=28095 RepID=UPI001C23681D|nr:hypothetical protein [Burkholderia gladioli]MBU9198871.1 hypothetical protein [Burkholderia gladioli]
MVLPRTEFFERALRDVYQRLQAHPVVQQHLSGSIRLDGQVLGPSTLVELDNFLLSGAEFAQLLLVFDGARAHEQLQREVGLDHSPPGLYFTSVQTTLLQHPHKTRVGIYEEADDAGAEKASLWLYVEDGAYSELADEGYGVEVGGALHIDHLYLHPHAPDWLGTIAFALCAITAHCLGYLRVTLVAGGGVGYNEHMFGYLYWPKLGFDASLESHDEGIPEFAGCATVLDVLERDEQAWATYGSQRLMEFDLAPESRSWRKLLDYLHDKELL